MHRDPSIRCIQIMSDWQSTLTKESKGKVLGVWRGKTHHLHSPAHYDSDFLWDLPLGLPQNISWSETISWAVSSSFQLLWWTPWQKPLFQRECCPQWQGKHGSQSMRLVLQMRVAHLTFTQEAHTERTRVGIGYKSKPGSTMSSSSKASPLIFQQRHQWKESVHSI